MDMKELDRRIHKGVRNIEISPLFEKDVLYSLETYKEDPKGTLRPEYSHCWLTWQSKWIDSEGNSHWGNEAFSYHTLEEAEIAKKDLEKKLVV